MTSFLDILYEQYVKDAKSMGDMLNLIYSSNTSEKAHALIRAYIKQYPDVAIDNLKMYVLSMDSSESTAEVRLALRELGYIS